MKRCFGDTLRARTQFGQFHDLLEAAIKNIEPLFSRYTALFRPSKHARFFQYTTPRLKFYPRCTLLIGYVQ